MTAITSQTQTSTGARGVSQSQKPAPAKKAEAKSTPSQSDSLQRSQESSRKEKRSGFNAAALAGNFGESKAETSAPTQPSSEAKKAEAAKAETEAQQAAAAAQAQAQTDQADQKQPGTLKVQDGVKLSDGQRQDMEEINEAYKKEFNKDLTVTSGERTPADTREQLIKDMNEKKPDGESKADRLYKGNRAYEGDSANNDPGLKQVYQTAKDEAKTKKEPNETEDEYVNRVMDKHIEEQQSRGVQLSNHQSGNSVDVRTGNINQDENGMSADEVAFVKEEARKRGYVVKDEGNHLHMDKLKEGQSTMPVATTEPDDIDAAEANSRNVAQRRRESELAQKNNDGANQQGYWEYWTNGWGKGNSGGYDPNKAQNKTLPTEQ